VSEPTYEYIKGQGWVICNYPSHTFELKGVKVTLTNRKPVVGDKYWKLYEGSMYRLGDGGDGIPNFSKLEDYMRTHEYLLEKWPEIDVWTLDDYHSLSFSDAPVVIEFVRDC